MYGFRLDRSALKKQNHHDRERFIKTRIPGHDNFMERLLDFATIDEAISKCSWIEGNKGVFSADRF